MPSTSEVFETIRTMSDETRSADLLRAVELMSTDMAAAHRIAQQYESDPVADTIHAIIHRREGDFPNSIYWWRKVGFAVAAEVAAVYPDSDPVAFVRVAQRGDKVAVAKVEQAELTALRSVSIR